MRDVIAYIIIPALCGSIAAFIYYLATRKR